MTSRFIDKMNRQPVPSLLVCCSFAAHLLLTFAAWRGRSLTRMKLDCPAIGGKADASHGPLPGATQAIMTAAIASIARGCE